MCGRNKKGKEKEWIRRLEGGSGVSEARDRKRKRKEKGGGRGVGKVRTKMC